VTKVADHVKHLVNVTYEPDNDGSLEIKIDGQTKLAASIRLTDYVDLNGTLGHGYVGFSGSTSDTAASGAQIRSLWMETEVPHLSANASVLSGDTGNDWVVHTKYTVSVKLVDDNGFEIPASQAPKNTKVAATLKAGLKTIKAACKANQATELYDCVYTTAQTVGTYTLTVTVDGEQLPGSPFTADVAPGALAAGQSVAVGAGKTKAIAGSQAAFRVTAMDAYNNVLVAGGDSVAVEIKKELTFVKAKVVDEKNGSYLVTYTPKVAQQYTMTVDITTSSNSKVTTTTTTTTAEKEILQKDSNAIKNSPLTVKVGAGAASAKKSEVSGAGIAGAIAGEQVSVLVQLVDQEGNLLSTGGDQVTGNLTGIDVDVKSKDNKDGTYKLTYTVTTAGNFSLELSINGASFPEQPYQIAIVSAAADADTSYTRINNSSLTVAAGTLNMYYIVARDEFDNVATDSAGGDVFTANLTLQNQEHAAEHAGAVSSRQGYPGEYTVEWHVAHSGVYSLQTELNGEQLSDSPIDIVVTAAAIDASHCYVQGNGINTKQAQGVNATLVVHSRDQYNNEIDTGGQDVTVIITSSNDYAAGTFANWTIIDEGNGEYEIIYMLSQIGRFDLNVKLDNKHVKGSPFVITVAGAKPWIFTTDGLIVMGLSAAILIAVAGYVCLTRCRGKGETGRLIASSNYSPIPERNSPIPRRNKY
jgi:hypothetical protein